MFLGWILLEHGMVGLIQPVNVLLCWQTRVLSVPGIVFTQVIAQGSITFDFELVVLFEGLDDLAWFLSCNA